MGLAPRESKKQIYGYTVNKINHFIEYTKTRTPKPIYRHYKHYMLVVQDYLIEAEINDTDRFDPSPYYMLRLIEDALRINTERKYSVIEKFLGFHKQENSGKKMAIGHLMDIVLSFRKYQGFYPNSLEDQFLIETATNIIKKN